MCRFATDEFAHVCTLVLDVSLFFGRVQCKEIFQAADMDDLVKHLKKQTEQHEVI